MEQVRTAQVVRERCDTRETEFVAHAIWCDTETLLYTRAVLVFRKGVLKRCMLRLLQGIGAAFQLRAHLNYVAGKDCYIARDDSLGLPCQMRRANQTDACFDGHVADSIDPEKLAPGIPIPTSNRMDMDPTRFGTQSMAQM